MATEEKTILEKYITCLNTVDSDEGLQVCNNKRREMSGKLRQIASPPANRQKAQRGAVPQQPPVKQ